MCCLIGAYHYVVNNWVLLSEIISYDEFMRILNFTTVPQSWYLRDCNNNLWIFFINIYYLL